MRKDPPFDTEFIYATYILERAEEKGTLIVNKPQSLRDCNEKLFTAWFADLTPETLVTRNKAQLKAFWQNTATSFSNRWTAWAAHLFSASRKAIRTLALLPKH